MVAALAVPATAAAAPATNGIYSVDVSSAGNFTANTDSGHPAGANLRLTYPNGGRWLLHSYSSSTDYRLADGGTPGSVSDIANGKRFQYQPLGSDSLDVRQDVTVSGTSESDSVVRVALRVQNTGETPVKIGARAAVDFMLAGDDGPVFTPQGGAPLTAAQRYVDPTFSTFTLEDDDLGSATLRGVWTVASSGLGTTPPDVLEMADCCQGAEPPLLVDLPLSSGAIEWDNEVRWIWGQDAANGRTLAPGESTTFAIASSLSDAGGSGPPVNTAAPAISGDTTEGQTLTGTSGTWTSGPMTSYAYQWRRCDAEGTSCVDVAGATDAQYTLTAADVGNTMRVRVTADGTVSADSAPTAVIAAPDNVAPETAIDGGPSGTVAEDGATFTFSSEDGAQFECQLDGGSWTACTSPRLLSGLADGSHAFAVRAIDASLNVDASPASRTWTVDTQGPVTSLDQKPATLDRSTSATFAFSSEVGAQFECKLDGGSWTACTSPRELTGLSDGSHTFAVRAVDGAGNADQSPPSFTWTVDATAPVAPQVTQRPDASTTARSATIAFTGQVGERFVCKVDAANYVDCTSPLELSGLGLGDHVVKVIAVDAAGNGSAAATIAWTVVAPAPDPVPEETAPVTPPAPKEPKLIATVTNGIGTPRSGTGTTPSGTTAVKVAGNGVDVGCRMTGVELASCRVELYADVDEDAARRARTAATRRMLVGTGIVKADGRTNRLAVRIELNQLGRRLMRQTPTGLKVRVATTGRPRTGEPLKATSTVQLVPQTARLLLGGYRPDQSRLPARARRALRKLANSLAPGARIKVVGHTDNSWRDDQYLRRLGRKRATRVVRYLRSRGVKATYVVRSRAATQPRATNATDGGRARNRRVALTIVR